MDAEHDLFVEGDIETSSDFSLGGNLSVGGDIYSSSGGTDFSGNVTITGVLFTDRIDDELGTGLAIDSDTAFGGDLTVEGGDLYGPSGLTINADNGNPAILYLGAEGEYDNLTMAGNMTIYGYLSISGNLSTANVFGRQNIIGTVSDYFIIDKDDTTDTPTFILLTATEMSMCDGNDLLQQWNCPMT